LFAVACCRAVQHLLGSDQDHQALTVVERFADGLASPAELGSVPDQTTSLVVDHAAAARAMAAATLAAAAASTLRAKAGDRIHPRGQGNSYVAEMVEKAVQCRILRDLFGNPFSPLPSLAPQLLAWNAGTGKRLAEKAYEQRIMPAGSLDPDRLSVLADALEEAGCTDPAILGHLRGPGPHARGCWCLDLLLDRS
jgi:hypothetical protein